MTDKPAGEMPGMGDPEPILALSSARERKRLREVVNVTQSELAAYLCVSRQTVNNWERGSSEPSGDNRVNYVAVLTAWKAKLRHEFPEPPGSAWLI